MIAIYKHVRVANSRGEKTLFKLKDITGKGRMGIDKLLIALGWKLNGV